MVIAISVSGCIQMKQWTVFRYAPTEILTVLANTQAYVVKTLVKIARSGVKNNMLRDEIELYESLTGKDANSVSVAVIGAFLDGYEIGKKENEPKKGKWFHYEGGLTCSVCNIEFYDDIMEYTGDNVPKFCPNCGADMRGDDND